MKKSHMKNYEITEFDSERGTAILKITEGKFSGTEFYFGKISFGEDTDPNNYKVTFDFTVTKSPDERSVQEIENSVECQTLIGDILIDILEEHTKSHESNHSTESNS